MPEHLEWAEETLRDIFAKERLDSVIFVMDYYTTTVVVTTN